MISRRRQFKTRRNQLELRHISLKVLWMGFWKMSMGKFGNKEPERLSLDQTSC
jgi:hypothetical protein